MSDLKIFTTNVEESALSQIDAIMSHPAFADQKVRIMPDVHAGAGCVIGFTSTLGDKIIPNIVGVDIGCGVKVVKIGNDPIDFSKLDNIIRQHVPYGHNVNDSGTYFDAIDTLVCYRELQDTRRFLRAIGSLGSGNHFIAIERDETGCQYLLIHSGSRNLGKQVADYYQKLASEIHSGRSEYFRRKFDLIETYKASGRRSEIAQAIKDLGKEFPMTNPDVPEDLCWLEGQNAQDYLHDMAICQDYAMLNRDTMSEVICGHMGFDVLESWTTVHNYIDMSGNCPIVRKGAVSAKSGEMLVIPINMRDGSLICRGHGNEDWNCSSPHGAGRLMSRNKARDVLDVAEFVKGMGDAGIYTTTANASTIDEAPGAYKSIEDIVANIGDTVEILAHVRPVYNFKAS